MVSASPRRGRTPAASDSRPRPVSGGRKHTGCDGFRVRDRSRAAARASPRRRRLRGHRPREDASRSQGRPRTRHQRSVSPRPLSLCPTCRHARSRYHADGGRRKPLRGRALAQHLRDPPSPMIDGRTRLMVVSISIVAQLACTTKEAAISSPPGNSSTSPARTTRAPFGSRLDGSGGLSLHPHQHPRR